MKQILCYGIQPSVAALLYGIFFQYFLKIRSYSPVFFLHVWNGKGQANSMLNHHGSNMKMLSMYFS